MHIFCTTSSQIFEQISNSFFPTQSLPVLPFPGVLEVQIFPSFISVVKAL